MEGIETKICRLCLKVYDSNFESIEEDTRRMLNALFIKNLSITEEAFACQNCTESIQKLFDFKSACLYTQDCINSFVREGHTTELNLKEIYLTKNKNAVNIPEDRLVCQLCMELVGPGSSLFLNSEEKCSVRTKVMLQKCLPELRLDVAKESVVCITCCEFLESYSNFIATCLNVEGKIENFFEVEGASNKGQVKLCQVLDFSLNGSLENKDSLEKIKTEGKCFENKEDIIEIKEEEEDIDIRIEEVMVETADNYLENFGDSIEIPMCSFEETMYNSETSVYTNIHRQKLEDPIQTHDESLDNCDVLEEALPLKSVPEETIYKCEICEHHTKNRHHLKSHMLVHKSTSEATMYKCTECTYQTKYKSCLPRHILSHKKISEVTAFKCNMCSYRTRRNDTLRKHLRTHNQLLEFTLDKNVADVAPYKCDTCSYQTNNKRCLVAHVLRHVSNLEVTVYKCEICEYHTKHRQDLKSHMLVHKRKSEVTLYQCTQCTYQTKYNSCLHRHLLSHKNISEVAAYKCEMCSYRTRRGDSLRKHMRTHKKLLDVKLDKNVSDVAPHKCDM